MGLFNGMGVYLTEINFDISKCWMGVSKACYEHYNKRDVVICNKMRRNIEVTDMLL
jgi:hypothetical protein